MEHVPDDELSSVFSACLAPGERIAFLASGRFGVAPARVHGFADRITRSGRLRMLVDAAHVAVTDRRLIVTVIGSSAERTHTVPFGKISKVGVKRAIAFGVERVFVNVDGGDDRLALQFVSPWLDEGEAIGGFLRDRWLNRSVSEHSVDEMRAGWTRLRDLREISQAEFDQHMQDLVDSAPRSPGWVLQAGMEGVPAAWYADPTALHELRYWDGVQWTEHVANRGFQSIDTLARDSLDESPVDTDGAAPRDNGTPPGAHDPTAPPGG